VPLGVAGEMAEPGSVRSYHPNLGADAAVGCQGAGQPLAVGGELHRYQWIGKYRHGDGRGHLRVAQSRQFLDPQLGLTVAVTHEGRSTSVRRQRRAPASPRDGDVDRNSDGHARLSPIV